MSRTDGHTGHRARLVWVAAVLSLLPLGCVVGATSGGYIEGIVRGRQGPEAGVWVIAETTDLPTKFAKIVVTDDKGRYVLPDLPQAKYRVWVRGYGLVDSNPMTATPGKTLDLEAQLAPSPQEAAQYYPASYWYSLLHTPPASDFPGTGPSGNGILPLQKTQQGWISGIREECDQCHTLGTEITRTLPPHPEMASTQAWNTRVLTVGRQDPPIQGTDLSHNATMFASFMNSYLGRLGRTRAVQMFADWSDRIAAGEVPQAPPRPQGIERNIVITQWDWQGGQFIHDSAATDLRQPTVNANGPVIGVSNIGGPVALLDPNTHTASQVNVPGTDGSSQNDLDAGLHTDTFDKSGRLWSSDNRATMALPEKDATPNPCKDAAAGPYAAYFPRNSFEKVHLIAVFDPKTRKVTRIPTCFESHHLAFADDKDNTLYFSGDSEVVGWINTAIYDRTGDWKKSIGWCPFVLDTNGDGTITPDRTQWNDFEGQIDPTKDTRLTGFPYGMGTAPDGSIWIARWQPEVPSGIYRIEVGSNPPRTCKTEYYEPPHVEGSTDYKAFNARGVAVDSKGIAWVAFGSGQIGRFDRTSCKVRNGKDALGQQCPEGWEFFTGPGAMLKGVDQKVAGGSTDWYYLTFVDRFDVFGLGKDVPFFPATTSDAVMAFLPDSHKFVVIRLPYPLNSVPRGVDARIDDSKAGWKGRGLWMSANNMVLHHMEGGSGARSKVFKVQMRPDPLAH